MKQLYYYIDVQGLTAGPVNKEFFKKNGVNPQTWVWVENLPMWVEARDIPSLSNLLSKDIERSFVNLSPEDADNVKVSLRTPGEDLRNEKLSSMTFAPRSWLLESVLVTIFCFLPFGIIALVYAAKVKSLWEHGKYAESIESSRSAGYWAKWGLAIAVIGWFMVLFIIILVPASVENVDWQNQYWIKNF